MSYLYFTSLLNIYFRNRTRPSFCTYSDKSCPHLLMWDQWSRPGPSKHTLKKKKILWKYLRIECKCCTILLSKHRIRCEVTNTTKVIPFPKIEFVSWKSYLKIYTLLSKHKLITNPDSILSLSSNLQIKVYFMPLSLL